MKIYMILAIENEPYSNSEKRFFFTDKVLAEQTIAQAEWVDKDGYTWKWLDCVYEREISEEIIKSPL